MLMKGCHTYVCYVHQPNNLRYAAFLPRDVHHTLLPGPPTDHTYIPRGNQPPLRTTSLKLNCPSPGIPQTKVKHLQPRDDGEH